jgi:orotate phosphoribosyltransferase
MSSIMELFQQTEAYLRGHFRLTSGLHSGEYLQCAKVLAYPKHAERLGKELAEKIKGLTAGVVIDAVVSPAMGGIIIGHETARSLGVLSLFTERDAASNAMTLRRGFEIKPGQRVVIIEDVITTGGSTKEVVTVMTQMGAEVLAAGSIIDRSGGRADVGVPRVSLQTLEAVAYTPEECPLCKEGLPVVKPGSRRT